MTLIFFLIISFNPSSLIKANKIDFDKLNSQNTLKSGRTSKIVFVPIKDQTSTYLSNTKKAQEIFYYYLRNGMRGYSINTILFEDGDFFELNNDYSKDFSYTNNNENYFVTLLVYKDEFDISNFASPFYDLKNYINENIIPNGDIDKVTDIIIGNLEIVDIEGEIGFDIILDNENQNQTIQSYFGSLNYSSQKIGKIQITESMDGAGVQSNSIHNFEIDVKNISDFDMYLGENQTIKIKSIGNTVSPYLVNDVWLDTNTIKHINSGMIKINDILKVAIPIKTPILPGDHSFQFQVLLNDQKIGEYKYQFNIVNSGQKVLTVKTTELGYLTVRANSSASSQEIGRATSGTQYIYSELQNGFYKIDYNGKEGWVHSSYVNINQ